MKFLVLLLATAAFASASFIGGKYIDIKEDGTIYVKGDDGKQIYITKNYGPYGQNIEIEVTGPNDFAKLYKFDYNTINKNYQGQYDILDVIFREYLGHVDEYTYDQLLNKLEKAVLNGYFDGKVLYILQALVEESKWNHLISGKNVYGQIGEVLNKMAQQNEYGLGVFGKLFKGQGFYGQDYNQYDVDYYYNYLFKIFDRKVLRTYLMQGQMYNQEMYGQYSYEKMWDMIFSHEGIFDYQYLVEIISNPMLRTWFVQHGYFDKVVLDKILYTHKTEGVYHHYLLERLFNTQVLKYFFVNRGISVYDILGQTTYKQYYGNTFFNKGVYGYNMLRKIINEPQCRNTLVQYGIFNKNVLDQILYRYSTEGVYDEVLFKQLVNKEVLYNFLVKCGVVDQTLLRELVDNEYLGLNYIYRHYVLQQSSRMSYGNWFGIHKSEPEYNYKYGGNYWMNTLYGQQYSGKQDVYSYGNWYHQYPMTQTVY